MKTFFKIIELHSQKILNKDFHPSDNEIVKHHLSFMMNHFDEDPHSNNDTTKGTTNLSSRRPIKFGHRIKCSNLIQKKFEVYQLIIKNMFITKKNKETIQEIFHKSQRTYHILIQFAQKIRMRKTKIHVHTDLSLIPIESNQKNTIIIYQNKTKYLFTLSDMINIILNAITNSPSLFAEPLVPKNPYNNIPFSRAILYYIYWTIKSSTILMPSLINNYFWCDFNFQNFVLNNEQNIREHSIKKYVMNSPMTTLYDEIITMLQMNKSWIRNRIKIHRDFPKNQLVEIMKPYLYLYIMKNDGIYGTEKKRIAHVLFRRELINFMEHNPTFGRKKVTQVSSSLPTFSSSFDVSGNQNVINNHIIFHIPSVCFALPSNQLSSLDRDRHGFDEHQRLSNNIISKKKQIINFNVDNPGLTIAKIEKMFKNYGNQNDDLMTSESESESESEIDDEEDPFEFQRELPYGLQYEPIINRFIMREPGEIIEDEEKEEEEEEEKDSIS